MRRAQLGGRVGKGVGKGVGTGMGVGKGTGVEKEVGKGVGKGKTWARRELDTDETQACARERRGRHVGRT